MAWLATVTIAMVAEAATRLGVLSVSDPKNQAAWARLSDAEQQRLHSVRRCMVSYLLDRVSVFEVSRMPITSLSREAGIQQNVYRDVFEGFRWLS